MKLSDNIIQLRHYTESKGQIPMSASFRKVNGGWVSNIPLFKRRIFSFIVDLAVVSCFNIAVFQGFALGIDELFTPVTYNFRLNLLTGISSEVYFGVFISLYMAYFLFTGFVWDGKSFGKRLFKLSIVTNNFLKNKNEFNASMSFEDSCMRSFGYTLCYLSLGAFFIFNFVSEDKRGIVEMLSNSKTVSDEWLDQELDKRELAREQVLIDITTLSVSAPVVTNIGQKAA